MTEQIFTILGAIGNILLITAYLPQISKIIKTKHAEDLSLLMWINYLIGDLLLLVYAIHTNDAIVASLFTIMTIGNVTVLYLTFKYGRITLKRKNKLAKADTKETKESADSKPSTQKISESTPSPTKNHTELQPEEITEEELELNEKQ